MYCSKLHKLSFCVIGEPSFDSHGMEGVSCNTIDSLDTTSDQEASLVVQYKELKRDHDSVRIVLISLRIRMFDCYLKQII